MDEVGGQSETINHFLRGQRIFFLVCFVNGGSDELEFLDSVSKLSAVKKRKCFYRLKKNIGQLDTDRLTWREYWTARRYY